MRASNLAVPTAAHADLVSPSASLRALVPDKVHPSAADAGDGADNAANGVGDVVVGAGRMVDAVAAGARDPPLQADDLGDGGSKWGRPTPLKSGRRSVPTGRFAADEANLVEFLNVKRKHGSQGVTIPQRMCDLASVTQFTSKNPSVA